MKKWLFTSLAGLLILSLLLAGCGPTTEPEPTATTAPEVTEPEPEVTEPEPTAVSTGDVLRAGMVSDVGGIDDASFNQNTWEGLERAQDELGVEVQFIESQASCCRMARSRWRPSIPMSCLPASTSSTTRPWTMG